MAGQSHDCAMKPEQPTPLVWESDLPLFSRQMLVQWTLGISLSALVMFVIVGVVFAASGDWENLLPLAGLALAVGGGLWLLGWLIMVVVFRGRMRMRYTLSDKALRCETIDRRARAGNRLAVVVGLMARSPQTVGAGLIAQSQETMEVRWSGAFRAKYDPRRLTIALRNTWRTLMLVQCNADNYAEVTAAIAHHMERRRTESRVAKKSPVPAYLLRTVLVIVGTLPLFPLADAYHISLFLPILILCFGLATVWMINLFGWVVMAALVVQALLVLADMFTERKSVFFGNETYYGFEVLNSDDYALLVLAGMGAALLVWLCLNAVRGRWLSALLDGYKDMG